MPDGGRPGGPIGPSQFGVERFTIPDVLDQRAEQIGDRTMMTIAGTPVTFAQMRDRSCAAANVLADNGVARGDTVALFTATCPEWVYFWLGAARIGAVTAAVNVANKDEFLVHALRLSRAKVVITDAERHGRLNEIVDRVETARTVLVVGDSLTDELACASTAPPDAEPNRSGRVGRAVLHLGHHRTVEGGGNDMALPVLGGGRRGDCLGACGG